MQLLFIYIATKGISRKGKGVKTYKYAGRFHPYDQ